MHLLQSFNDRRVNKRALKAANGPRLSPKKYKNSDADIAHVQNSAGEPGAKNWPTKDEYHSAAKRFDRFEKNKPAGATQVHPDLKPDKKTYRAGTEIK